MKLPNAACLAPAPGSQAPRLRADGARRASCPPPTCTSLLGQCPHTATAAPVTDTTDTRCLAGRARRLQQAKHATTSRASGLGWADRPAGASLSPRFQGLFLDLHPSLSVITQPLAQEPSVKRAVSGRGERTGPQRSAPCFTHFLFHNEELKGQEGGRGRGLPGGPSIAAVPSMRDAPERGDGGRCVSTVTYE